MQQQDFQEVSTGIRLASAQEERRSNAAGKAVLQLSMCFSRNRSVCGAKLQVTMKTVGWYGARPQGTFFLDLAVVQRYY